MLYGYAPRHFGISSEVVVPVPELADWLQECELMSRVIQLHLSRAQQRMKKQADKSRSERQFSVGEWVFLKLQPYIQSSVATRSNNKLCFKFFGPYQILERIGMVAYKLRLPANSTVHPVFHVSQLKRAIGRDSTLIPQLPCDSQAVQVPMKILQRRMVERGGDLIAQVKVLWSGMADELATWEDAAALQDQFPAAPAWGQAGSEGRGNVGNQKVDADSVEEAEAHGDSRKRNPRNRRPNTRIVGPMGAV